MSLLRFFPRVRGAGPSLTRLLHGPPLLGLVLLGLPSVASAETSALPETAAVQQQHALDKTAVALRLEIEEQPAAAGLAHAEAQAQGARVDAVWLAAGRHEEWQGRWDAAAASYGAITRLDPYGAGGYALLGQMQVLQGQKEGIGYLTKALEMDSASAAARLPLARLARASGDLDRVRSILEGIAAEDRQLPEVVLEQASLELLQGRVEVARQLLDRLRSADPTGKNLTVAELWLAHGQCSSALPLLAEEVRCRPRAESWRSLGRGLLCCGRDPRRAAGAFHSARKLDPGDNGAAVGLAWSLLALPPSAETETYAAGLLDGILTLDAGHPAALLARSELHLRQKQLAEAAALLERIPRQHPAADEADVQRARLALQREDPYAAVDLLRKLAERRPDLLHVQADLVQAYLRAGRSKEARETAAALSARVPAGHALRTYTEQLLASRRSPR